MDEEAKAILETYKKRALRRLPWWKMSWFHRCLKIAFVLTVLTVVFYGFGYHHELKKTITDFETLTGEEWEKYTQLSSLAVELQAKRNRINVYERLLTSYEQKEFSSSYTQSDSLAWASSLQQNKKEFNAFLEKSWYNSEIKNHPKFIDPDRMKKAGLSILPHSFRPYVLTEQLPDSTEEEQKPDAH